MHLYDPECKGILDTNNLYFLVNSVLLNLYWYIHQRILKKVSQFLQNHKSSIYHLLVRYRSNWGHSHSGECFIGQKNCVGKDDLSISVKDQFWLLKSTNTNRQS